MTPKPAPQSCQMDHGFAFDDDWPPLPPASVAFWASFCACFSLNLWASRSFLCSGVSPSSDWPFFSSCCFFWFLARAISLWFPPVQMIRSPCSVKRTYLARIWSVKKQAEFVTVIINEFSQRNSRTSNVNNFSWFWGHYTTLSDLDLGTGASHKNSQGVRGKDQTVSLNGSRSNLNFHIPEFDLGLLFTGWPTCILFCSHMSVISEVELTCHFVSKLYETLIWASEMIAQQNPRRQNTAR